MGFCLVNSFNKIHYKTKLALQFCNTAFNNQRKIQPIILSSLAFGLIFFNGLNLSVVCASDSSIQIQVLADSIRIAEGNPNYGILKKIKGRNYRKACIQTIQHQMRHWKEQGSKGSFIAFLGAVYCPTSGANLRPAEKKLNRYWISNVSSIYKRLLSSKSQQLKKFNGNVNYIS